MKTLVRRIRGRASEASAARAAKKVLKRGGTVVFPTETVYGLAADPRSASGMRKIRLVKGRKAAKAITLQVASVGEALALVRESAAFENCARAFWPGPVTLIGRRRGGAGKTGLRVPKHRFALKLLEAYGSPLAVTSANPSGAADLRTEKQILGFAEGKVDLVVVGPRPGGLVSTVVDLTGPKPAVLRAGPVSYKEILDAARRG